MYVNAALSKLGFEKWAALDFSSILDEGFAAFLKQTYQNDMKVNLFIKLNFILLWRYPLRHQPQEILHTVVLKYPRQHDTMLSKAWQ